MSRSPLLRLLEYFYSAQQEFCENCFDLYITVSRKAVGYDLTTSPSKATTHTYDVYGNLASRTDALGRLTTSTYAGLGPA